MQPSALNHFPCMHALWCPFFSSISRGGEVSPAFTLLQNCHLHRLSSIPGARSCDGAVVWEPVQGHSFAPQVFACIAAWDARQKSFACYITVSEQGHLKHRLLEKSKSGVRRENLKEKASFVHVLSNPATHLVCLVLKLKLFFSSPCLSKYSALSLVHSSCFLLQATEKDFCGREDVTTGNS